MAQWYIYIYIHVCMYIRNVSDDSVGAVMYKCQHICIYIQNVWNNSVGAVI